MFFFAKTEHVYKKTSIYLQFEHTFTAHCIHIGILHTTQLVFVFLSLCPGQIAHLFLFEISCWGPTVGVFFMTTPIISAARQRSLRGTFSL